MMRSSCGCSVLRRGLAWREEYPTRAGYGYGCGYGCGLAREAERGAVEEGGLVQGRAAPVESNK
jgi:hypothetical protein